MDNEIVQQYNNCLTGSANAQVLRSGSERKPCISRSSLIQNNDASVRREPSDEAFYRNTEIYKKNKK